jgi:hypothetical protein
VYEAPSTRDAAAPTDSIATVDGDARTSDAVAAPPDSGPVAPPSDAGMQPPVANTPCVVGRSKLGECTL